jgi:hypothetical protein
VKQHFSLQQAYIHGTDLVSHNPYQTQQKTKPKPKKNKNTEIKFGQKQEKKRLTRHSLV